MNHTAYLTTDIAIKALSKLLKARTVFHGLGNIPDGPIIFVINHFTRLETLLLPYYLFHLTETRVWSLADDGLFSTGALKAYFDKVGVISTKNPQRDRLIIKTLLTGQAHWIIFPEGRMVKTKKLVSNGEYRIGDDHSTRTPHTGAASLALRAEIFRRFLQRDVEEDEGRAVLADFLDIGIDDDIAAESVKIVPVNLTYYPIRAHDNILSGLAARFVKTPSERMLEELMTEGTMLLEGVDIDMQFSRPLDTEDELQAPLLQTVMNGPVATDFANDERIGNYLRNTAGAMMRTYMERIYSATTVNLDHLFASLLRRRSFRPFSERMFARSVYLVSDYLHSRHSLGNNLHSSLTDEQLHLLVDDRFSKCKDFLELAVSTGSLVKDQQMLRKESSYWQSPALFHKARILNPTEVMANEIEPLAGVQKQIRLSSRLPDFIAGMIIARRLFTKDIKAYRAEHDEWSESAEFEKGVGSPFLLPSYTNRLGV
ncbi:MAG: 1-acyl-sn-glycerol-3-phosphate acyltransferase, partial [Desulfocapsaceae bacterium]|nr:1-acyl-sn-glycerol-3-phosphate acyltransferase [Desulfocapsaceae bacterium]